MAAEKIKILKDFEEQKEKKFFEKKFSFGFDLVKYDAEDISILFCDLASKKIKFTYCITYLLIEF